MPEIRNPNLQTQGSGGGGGGGSSSNMIFWMFLILVFLGWQFFFNKPKAGPAAPTQTTQQSVQQPVAQTPVQTQAAVAQVPRTAARASTPQITAATETTTTVENELYRIVFTNRGGQVQHWVLKKYSGTDGKPLDLVQPQITQFGLPLSLYTYEPNLTQQLNTALYQVTVQGSEGGAGPVLAPATLTFRYSGDGLDVVKTIHFDSTYLLTVDAEVKQNGSMVRALVQWPSGLGDMEEFLPSSATRSQVRTSATSQYRMAVERQGGFDDGQEA